VVHCNQADTPLSAYHFAAVYTYRSCCEDLWSVHRAVYVLTSSIVTLHRLYQRGNVLHHVFKTRGSFAPSVSNDMFKTICLQRGYFTPSVSKGEKFYTASTRGGNILHHMCPKGGYFTLYIPRGICCTICVQRGDIYQNNFTHPASGRSIRTIIMT
jgi:hypothetical protein